MIRRLIILLLIVGCDNSTENKNSCSMEIPFSWCFSDCECRSIIQNTGIDTVWSFGYTLNFQQKFYSNKDTIIYVDGVAVNGSIEVLDSIRTLSDEVNSEYTCGEEVPCLLPDSTLIHYIFNFYNGCNHPDSTSVSVSNFQPNCINP